LSIILVRNQTIMQALFSILVNNGYREGFLSEPIQLAGDRFSFKYEGKELFDVKILRQAALSETVELIFDISGKINLDKFYLIFDDLEKKLSTLKFTFTL